MNIWFDIAHIPQYNFYKWLMLNLAAEGHNVTVTVLQRGRLAKIVNKEIGGTAGIEIVPMGRHRSRKWSAILEANLLRIIQLLIWSRGRHFGVGFSNGYQLAMIGALKGMPSYSFDDDPETIDYRPKLWWNRETNYCIYSYDKPLDPRAHILPVLKEWSYLSPDYFKADISALEPYGLKPKEYIFVREVSVGTVNYAGQSYGAVADVAGLIPAGKKVLLSLEKKDTRSMYPQDWIMLQEPVRDIHSLIYFSSALVSSGDSMAREAALLGVPSYYLGVRHGMPANRAAAALASLDNAASKSFEDWISGIDGSAEEQSRQQQELRATLRDKLMDINSYMMEIVNKIK